MFVEIPPLIPALHFVQDGDFPAGELNKCRQGVMNDEILQVTGYRTNLWAAQVALYLM